MSNETTWLISLTNGQMLFRVAFKFINGTLKGDAQEYPLEPENKEYIRSLLPPHISSGMTIVEVETIFDLLTNNKKHEN